MPQIQQIFVKLPLYVADWCRTKYKGNGVAGPIHLPVTGYAGRIIYRNLTSNPDFELVTHKCYNAMMFNRSQSDVPEEWRERLPQNRNDYTAFAIHPVHWYEGRYIPCDDTMQLGKRDATDFVDILTEEFWDDLDDFSSEHDRDYQIHHNGRHHEEYNMLLDFCEFYAIDIDNTEALYRQYKRRKHKAAVGD